MKIRRRKAPLIARMLRAVPPRLTIWTVEDDGQLWVKQLSRREERDYAGKLFTGEIGSYTECRFYTSQAEVA